MEDRLPDDARDLDHAPVGQELREIAAHRRRRRRVRRAEIDSSTPIRARPVVLERRLRRGTIRRPSSRDSSPASRRALSPPARASRAAPAAASRAARPSRPAPAAPSARGRSGRRGGRSGRRETRTSRRSRFSTWRPVAEYVYVATQCARPVAASAVDVRRDDREILAARAQHPPHRRDAGGVERGEHRVGERGVGRVAGDHRRRRRGGRAPRRSAAISAAFGWRAGARHQSFI